MSWKRKALLAACVIYLILHTVISAKWVYHVTSAPGPKSFDIGSITFTATVAPSTKMTITEDEDGALYAVTEFSASPFTGPATTTCVALLVPNMKIEVGPGPAYAWFEGGTIDEVMAFETSLAQTKAWP